MTLHDNACTAYMLDYAVGALSPAEHLAAHHHGRRDVTVVLVGAYADEFAQYERGDIVFAEPRMKHQPRAVGDRSCVCLIATESGKPLSGLLGLFASGIVRSRGAP